MKSPDPSDDDLTDLLSEIRLLFPGTQILVAFLIILPFNSGYTRVSSLDNAVYVVMFVCAMISLLMFIAPAAQHRLMQPLRDRAAFKRVHSRGSVIWCQAAAGSGGSQGFPASAPRMASSAVRPWAAAESR